jgi:hypothetical protein
VSIPDLAERLNVAVDLLKGVGLTAAVDPADVDVPGCWVDLTGVLRWTLKGCDVACEVVLIVPAVDGRAQQYAALQVLLDKAVEAMGIPDGDVRKQATVLPESPVAYPSLVLPYWIR